MVEPLLMSFSCGECMPAKKWSGGQFLLLELLVSYTSNLCSSRRRTRDSLTNAMLERSTTSGKRETKFCVRLMQSWASKTSERKNLMLQTKLATKFSFFIIVFPSNSYKEMNHTLWEA